VTATSTGQLSGDGLLSSNRNRLLLLLIVSTVAIGAIAWRAASGDISYYVEPHEFLEQIEEGDTNRWRVGGRVVYGTIVEQNGRPVAFAIEGEDGSRIAITYEGIVPNLFTAGAFVVIDGALDGGEETLSASRVIIKHENEFFADTPPSDSPSSNLVPD
jgi:cytochrome c-type biogenesis protein CcmE